MTVTIRPIMVRASRGEGAAGQPPLAIRQLALEFEQVYPREVIYELGMELKDINAALARAVELKCASCDGPAFRFELSSGYKVGHVIDPVNSSTWIESGERAGVIVGGKDASGTVYYFGFDL